MQEKICLAGKDYPVTGYHTDDEAGTFPVAEVPMMSDYKWQQSCLDSRLEHPEYYPNEDVPATVKRLRAWLDGHRKVVA